MKMILIEINSQYKINFILHFNYMIQIKLTNTKIKEEINNKIIYQPKTYSDTLDYKIIIKSKISYQIQFVIYADFIDWIEFFYTDQSAKSYKYNYLSNQGMLVSHTIKENNYLTINFKPIDLCTRIIIKNINPIMITQLSLITWDNIFIINLQRRADRREQMEKKLLEASINTYEFIEALDGLDPDITKQFVEIKKNPSNPIVTSGHFACLLSHIKAIQLAKSRNYSKIMILEDDVYFCNNFLDKLTNLIVPNSDMIYLGGIVSKKKLFLSEWAVCNGYKIMGAYGYILSKSIYDTVLSRLEKLLEYVDFLYIKQIQPNYKVILLNDFIKTDLTSTDTSHKSKKLIKRLEYII